MRSISVLVAVIIAAALGVLLVMRFQQAKANESRTAAARAARWKREEKNDDAEAAETDQNANN